MNDAERPVAIVVPTDIEFGEYRRSLALAPLAGAGPWDAFRTTLDGRPLVLIISDVGPANAGAATERIIATCDPVAVLHGGSAGAHNPELLPGDIVVGARYVPHATRAELAAREFLGFGPKHIRFRRGGERVRMDHVEADPELLVRALLVAEQETRLFGAWPAPGWPVDLPHRPARALAGVIASADSWTVEADELTALRETFGAECEDMESVYVAQICAMHAVPFLAVRAISNNDAACHLAPDEVTPAIAAAGDRAARVLIALARSLSDA